jgi:hypothetical protein
MTRSSVQEQLSMRFSRFSLHRVLVLLPLLLCMALGVVLMDPSDLVAKSRPQDRSASKIKVGEFPPDFELPVLKFETDGEGKPVGVISERESIRLSSYQGKRPVCMIMSSYT